MAHPHAPLPAARARALIGALLLVVAASLVSGCGSSGSGCLAPGPCAGDFPPEPVTPSVDRRRVTTQVGGTAVVSVHIEGISSPAVQWMRAPAGGHFSSIPGATGATYTLQGATTLDDGASFQASVSGGFNGQQVSLASNTAVLTVVSQPPVVLQDGTFAPGDWTAAASVSPATAGPTHVEQQVSTGGNPGAYRSTAITLPAGVSQLIVFDEYQGASYDPATQGALLLVDFIQDCQLLPGPLGAGPTLLLTQNGRRYLAGGPTLCGTSTWRSQSLIDATFDVTQFGLVAGPACGVGEACPDFSAGGLPMHFGFANANQGSPGFAGGTGGFGIDNWKVTLWRR